MNQFTNTCTDFKTRCSKLPAYFSFSLVQTAAPIRLRRLTNSLSLLCCCPTFAWRSYCFEDCIAQHPLISKFPFPLDQHQLRENPKANSGNLSSCYPDASNKLS